MSDPEDQGLDDADFNPFFSALLKRDRRIAELEAKVERLYTAAVNGIGHVGAANYAEREAEAYRWVEEAMTQQGGEQ